MKKFFEDFKAFAMRGNVIDMAVGVIIGAAFGSITTSLVNDIFMPLIGVLTGGINFGGLFVALDGGSYVSAEAAAAAGVGTINYGLFIQNVINFILTAFCMFLVIRAMNKIHKKPEAAPAKPKRISIKDTRGIIDAILDGSILKAPTKKIPYFDFEVPTELPGVDSKILDPRDTYADASEWEKKAQDLASRFIKNFAKYEGNEAGKKLVAAGPKL